MEQYMVYIFWLVVLIMASALGYSILNLCYTWTTIKIKELKELMR
jgi:Trk-type K+ transport system membrane component